MWMEARVGLQPTKGMHMHTHVPQKVFGFNMFVKFFKPNMARYILMGAGRGSQHFTKEHGSRAGPSLPLHR